MKKILHLSILLVFSISAFAQDAERHERIKALKTAFITQELNLTSTEAQKFWPVYNRYEEQNRALYKQENKIKERLKNASEALAEQEAKKITEQIQQLYRDEQKLKSGLIDELTKDFGAIFVVKLKKAEHDFKMQLLKKYKGEKK